MGIKTSFSRVRLLYSFKSFMARKDSGCQPFQKCCDDSVTFDKINLFGFHKISCHCQLCAGYRWFLFFIPECAEHANRACNGFGIGTCSRHRKIEECHFRNGAFKRSNFSRFQTKQTGRPLFYACSVPACVRWFGFKPADFSAAGDVA